MKKKTKKIISVSVVLIVAISMLILFLTGYLLGPDRRWVPSLPDTKPFTGSANE